MSFFSSRDELTIFDKTLSEYEVALSIQFMWVFQEIKIIRKVVRQISKQYRFNKFVSKSRFMFKRNIWGTSPRRIEGYLSQSGKNLSFENCLMVGIQEYVWSSVIICHAEKNGSLLKSIRTPGLLCQ